MPQNPWGVASVAPADPWGVASVAPAKPPQQGFLGSAADSSGLTGLVHAISHPIDTAMGIPSAVVTAAKNSWDNAHQEVNDIRQNGLTQDTRRKLGGDIPVIGPALATAQAQHEAGNDAGMAGTLTGLVGGIAAPEGLLGAARAIPGASRALIAGDVTKPVGVTGVSALDRFNSARNLGVNLDAADATNSPVLGLVKRVNSNSLLGGPAYDAAKANNTSALTGSTKSFLDQMYPDDRESGGLAIQNALKRNQQGLYGSATEGFESLPQDVPIPGLAEVGKTAQDIGRENAAYQNLFPSLKPNKAMNVVGDVGGLGPKGPAPLKMSPFVDESGQPIPSSAQAAPQQPASFGTGQKLRSDLIDFTRNNPDIVQNQGNGFIQRLAGQTDDALTNASSALTPEQLDTFRRSNADWKDMKQTYDDPSSAFYHAVRTDNPSSLYSGVGPKTPENARNLLARLTPPDSSVPSAAAGAVRRGTVESALKTTSDGSPNFPTFGTQLNRIPADYRAELFSPDQNRSLFDIASTSNALAKDFNPSGSGHQLQKVGEFGALAQAPATALFGHPALAAAPVAYNAAQYGVAKLMNSPSLVNWLMKQPAPATPFRLSTKIALPTASLALRSPKLGAQ